MRITSSLIKAMLVLFACSIPTVSSSQVTMTRPSWFAMQQVKPGTVETAPVAQITSDKSMREVVIRMREMKQSAGWIEVPERRAAALHGYFDDESVRTRLKPTLEDVSGMLKIVPAELNGTVLELATMTGVLPAGGFINGGWTGVARAMLAPGLGRVVLEEYDYVAAGSYIVVPEELVDSTINGLPSQFDVFRTKGGRSWTQLRWFTANKEFRLYLGKPVDKSDQTFNELMELAATIQ